MSKEKVGRECSQGGVCNWEAAYLPKKIGKGWAIWRCVKCGYEEPKEVEIS